MRASVLLLALFVSVAFAQTSTLIHLSNNVLRTFRTDSATIVSGPTTVTGTDTPLVTFTYRPSDKQFYALSRNSTLYTLNVVTGVASLYGVISCTLSTSTSVTYYSAFNPVVDALRVIGSDGSNRRLAGNPFLCTLDGALTYTDATTGSVNPVGLAYTNQTTGASGTAEYITDANGARFARVTAPNAGNTTSTSVPTAPAIAANTPLAVVTQNGVDTFYALGSTGVLYTVAPATGAFTSTGLTYAAGDAIAVVAIPSGTPTGPSPTATANPTGVTPTPAPTKATTSTTSTTNSAVVATVSIAAVAAVFVNMM